MLIKIVQLICFALGGASVAFICNVVLLRFSKSLGIRNKNDIVIRWSNESKPSLGGVSFFVVFVFAAIAYSIVYNDAPNIFQNKQYIGLFAAGSLAFLMGVADDAYNTKPLLKLSVQVLCGLLLVLTDTSIDLFHSSVADAILTVVWVVIVMNSLNMLDNMDGLAGTTVFFILTSCLLSYWIIFPFNINIWILLLVSLIGAIVGFLVMNVYPSKLFMGDAGSQFIGLVVAFFGINALWNIGGTVVNETHPSWIGFILILVAFTPTGVDTLTVFINRVRKGGSPMVGGKDHTSHHLVYAGLSERKVWVVFLIIGALSTLLSVAILNLMTLRIYVPVVFFIAYPIFVFVLLFRNTLRYPAPK